MKYHLPNREKVKENNCLFREVLVPLFRRLQEDLRAILFEPKVGVQCLASQPNPTPYTIEEQIVVPCLRGRMLHPLGMLGSKTLNIMLMWQKWPNLQAAGS